MEVYRQILAKASNKHVSFLRPTTPASVVKRTRLTVLFWSVCKYILGHLVSLSDLHLDMSIVNFKLGIPYLFVVSLGDFPARIFFQFGGFHIYFSPLVKNPG